MIMRKPLFAMLTLFSCIAFCMSLTSCDNDESEPTTQEYMDGEIAGHNYVDLGLPSGTLWATTNIGANKPEEYGLYFQWGMTEGYGMDPSDGKLFDWDHYSFCGGSVDTMRKYCTKFLCGHVDNKTKLELEDDAAYVNWGAEWCMPTDVQIAELINEEYTTVTMTVYNGVYGAKIAKKSDSNVFIFLPTAGYRSSDYHKDNDALGLYWSCTLDLRDNFAAHTINFRTSVSSKSGNRCEGLTIRPVIYVYNPVLVESITLEESQLTVHLGDTYTLKATVLPEDAEIKTVTWSSSDDKILSVSQSGVITANDYGTATITCSSTDGSNVAATCVVEVHKPKPIDANGHDYVDMGLPSGTLWASCNIGADLISDPGLYFSWGSTKGYTNIINDGKKFDWSDYEWSNGSETKLTKYCANNSYWDSSLGTSPDNKTELDLEDDAAHVNWGGDWQVPTTYQLWELIFGNFTTCTWITIHEVPGLLITSNSNMNTIFLPAAGYRFGGELEFSGICGYYWARSIDKSTCQRAHSINFDGDGMLINSINRRSSGQSIRPALLPDR